MKWIKRFESFIIEPTKVMEIYLLNEAFPITDEWARKQFKPVKEQLMRDCGKFINEIKNNTTDIFWRGTYSGPISDDDIIDERRPRKDRKPRDIEPVIQSAIDDIFQQQFGVRLRQQGIFTTKKSSDTIEYGIPFIFFPIGDYKAYWNESVEDLYSNFEFNEFALYFSTRDDNIIIDHFGDEFYEKEDEEDFNEDDWFLEKGEEMLDQFDDELNHIVDGYKEGDIDKATTQEVIFICDRYYLINPRYVLFIYEWFDIKIKD